MKLYSTLDRKIVDIVPIKQGELSIYSCGPTVYFRMHLGNLRAYVNWDILHRALLYLGYDVKRVMNITDVGHMSSTDDFGSDFGEDKMDKQAIQEGIQPIDIANKYTDTVLDDFRSLNILAPNGSEIPKDLTHENIQEYGWSRATEYIQQIIDIVKKIEANGYTYETKQAVYFDVTKIPEYTIFTGQQLSEKEIGVREEVEVDDEKKNPADFVLWMKRVGKYKDHIMNWPSPWGDGFPGWHIECTAMGTSILGEHFDIHTGGIDHIPVHHTNERAQNIGTFGHPVVKYWIHNEWLLNKDEDKLSKSKGGAYTLPEIILLGFDPLDVRYFFVSINYKTKVKFSLEALEGAKNSRLSLLRRVQELGKKQGTVIPEYVERFKHELENNLNMSGVLALINELLKSNNPKENILSTIYDFDKVLRLNLNSEIVKEENVDSEIEGILKQREEARLNKNFLESDRLRDLILSKGYKVLDTPNGQTLEKI
ncbi:cysteine--tRNA ligase [candidate division WS6 bacterium RIFOXYD1_FULL_33_8]|uniref:Cysteine--tRNA ligase n=2 Tax=Candidatus Dojkabacteria TaxID=74243 RepID=A0A0F9ZKP8_9BACT|nr:MAG: cysteinyl-tRNA synthetase, cysteinyl-tRNA synthetase [candidate division WS6 bacterium GW2011_GWE2_33_157]KKP44699.1 MAG: cysteinyl-tRNA synthetase, cysteinyl-tRNA synthetase [candidate division WS6 bacterium GW2011_GWC1_33_20]KKP45960.1 MAG: cysteinyl-tRNA synthetase, cysteinyl-tRNA synthetase [candidate division WS6 bacterium GW2011_GWF1_33_233]KKP55609.1 MAG: cysteinyl-tRNA synthetase, cysteinyl-tRNA synthetase [candidate division WS6 bacterium GW2011_WS6_33_547]KKP56992.1 MAG: Cyste